MRKIGKVSKNTSTKGQDGVAKSANCCAPKVEVPNSSEAGQASIAEKALDNMPVSDDPKPSVAGLTGDAKKASQCPPATEGDTVNSIRSLHRTRVFGMEQRKKLDLALGSFLRLMLGWRKDLPEAERDAIKLRAASMMKDPSDSEFEYEIKNTMNARGPFEEMEERSLKRMKQLAEGLRVWESFGKGVRGFGSASLAVILAETGDLSNYSNHSKVWKRLGLAVLDGVRQGGLAKGSSAEDWIAHGYNKKRRSLVWTIGDTLMKAQIRKVKDAAGEDTGERKSLGKYGEMYLRRKAYEIARDPEIAPIKAHRRAQRYAEKKLLRDLWAAWRVACRLAEKPKHDVPAEIQKAA